MGIKEEVIQGYRSSVTELTYVIILSWNSHGTRDFGRWTSRRIREFTGLNSVLARLVEGGFSFVFEVKAICMYKARVKFHQTNCTRKPSIYRLPRDFLAIFAPAIFKR